MLGWWDNTTSNSITFSNTGTSNPLDSNPITGGVVTNGAFSLTPSPALTNGDELYLPGSPPTIVVEKDFPVAIDNAIIQDIRLRAKNATGVSTTLTIKLLKTSGLSLVVALTQTVTLASALYTHYTIPVSLSAPIWGIQLSCDNGAYIDYVGFGTADYINQGGQSLNITIPKKTSSQTRPMTTDVIQQLGIGSRSKAVVIPKISTLAFAWLKDKLAKSIPLEVLSPTQQATGYLTDVKRHSEAGWVGSPVQSPDSLSVSTAAQQLYDVSFSLTKADNEVNIDTTVVVPITINPIVDGILHALPDPTNWGTGENFGNGIDYFATYNTYNPKIFYAVGRFWAFYETRAGNIAWMTTDGVTWTGPTNYASRQAGLTTAIYNASTNRVYLLTGTSSPAKTYWRYGTPQSDGTITWLIAEQSISPLRACSADVDASGNLWITGYPGGAPQVNIPIFKNGTIFSVIPNPDPPIWGTFFFPAIRVGTGGIMYVAAVRQAFPPNNLLIWHSTDSGATWSPQVESSNSIGIPYWDMTVLNNIACIVGINLTSLNASPLFFTVNSSGSKSSEVSLDNLTWSVSTGLSAAIGTDDVNTLVVYYNFNTLPLSSIVYRLSLDGGNTWQPKQTIDTTPHINGYGFADLSMASHFYGQYLPLMTTVYADGSPFGGSPVNCYYFKKG